MELYNIKKILQYGEWYRTRVLRCARTNDNSFLLWIWHTQLPIELLTHANGNPKKRHT